MSFRPSILLRPKKVSSTAAVSNSQHMEMEHEREEAKLAAKRDLRQQREVARGQQLWGSPAEKAELARNERAEHDAQRDARRMAEDRARQDADRAHREMLAKEQETRRAELAKIEAKRQYLATLRDDNARLAEQRQSTAKYQREEEKAVAAQAANQPTFLSKFGRHAY